MINNFIENEELKKQMFFLELLKRSLNTFEQNIEQSKKSYLDLKKFCDDNYKYFPPGDLAQAAYNILEMLESDHIRNIETSRHLGQLFLAIAKNE